MGGAFEKSIWPDSTRYIWQPKQNIYTRRRTTSTGENRRGNENMNTRIRVEDFLDPPQNEQVARMRQVTYSLPEIAAMTEEKPKKKQ